MDDTFGSEKYTFNHLFFQIFLHSLLLAIYFKMLDTTQLVSFFPLQVQFVLFFY